MADTTSIKRLRVYQVSRDLEDSVYELAKALPEHELYALGNDLRRSSAAVSHYIYEFHRHYSYSHKIEALHLARTKAEILQALLVAHQDGGYGPTKQLSPACVSVIKQCWGLIKYLKQQEHSRRNAAAIRASDELVAARA